MDQEALLPGIDAFSFGENGFFKVVDEVADVEKYLGIFDLSKFTP